METKAVSAVLLILGVVLVALASAIFLFYGHMLLWLLLYTFGFCAFIAGAQLALEK